MSDRFAREWERMYNEAREREFSKMMKLEEIGEIIARNWCDCDCDHHHDEHDSKCERCLACRINDVLGRPT